MNLEIIVRKKAEREMGEAHAWYEEQERGLGSEFIFAVDRSLERIQSNPFAYPVVHRSLRRALLPKFPYSLVFRIVGEKLILVACFHARRDPNEWMQRK